MSSDIIFYRYSPEKMSEDILRKLFVGREKLLESLVTEIGNAAKNKTPRFYLVVGPRGIGKSHFLTLLYYEIKNKFPSLLIRVKLAEEEYSVYRASDLFLRILEEYLVEYPGANSQEISEISSLEQEDEILHAAVEKLKQISKQDGKRFIIFVENLHELFKQLEKEELQKLRSIFQKNDIFSIVATAPLIFPSLSGHDEPFYNFFHILHLKEFSYHEIKELMQKIAETENGEEFFEKFEQYEERIHGIVHLTGGSPRLVFLFYDMIMGGEIENVEKAFFKVIDEHTPFYQEIFQMLTGQQRRIFDVLISFGETTTPKQISEKARVKLQTVNTQLRRLETDGYVISRPMGRHTKYEVRERLFRLWREMRQPFGRKRVSILLDFLQLWYTADERKELFKIKFELLEAGEKSVLKELCYYADIQPPEFKAEALLKLTSKLMELGEWEEAVYEIGKLKETAAQTKDKELEGKAQFYEGQLLLSEQKYDEALEYFNQALEINPKDDYALARKGVVLINLSKYDEALEYFNQALEINPNNDYALSRKGIALISLGKDEGALESFNQALEINPKDDYALSRKGIALIILGKYDEALESFNQVLEINPKNDIALSRKGFALIIFGKYDEALESFNQALEINPKNDYALSRKAFALENLGKDEEALEVFNQALEINPKDDYALSRKGFALINLGKQEEALEVFNQALEINPNNDYALSNKGLALGNLGKHDEALEYFNQALEINPKSDIALLFKSISLIHLDKYEDVLESSNQALEINPMNDIALSNKGLALGNLGKYEDALEAFNQALEINPNNDYALSNKGDAFINLCKDEEALEAFNQALEINPNNDYALSNKGDAFINLCKDEEALEAFNQALEINPNNDYALSRKGATLINLGKDEEALEYFNQALEINPKDDYTLSRKGVVLINLGKDEEALESFNQALEINPKDDYALSRKGAALINLGKYEEALEAFNQALEINHKNDYALSRRGIALISIGKNEEALEAFNQALEINPKDDIALSGKGAALISLGKDEEALEIFNQVLEINPKDKITLRNKAVALLQLKRHEEGLEVAKKILDIVTDNHFKIDALLIKIEAYIALNKKAEAAIEIEKIKDKIADQYPYLIIKFVEFSLALALEELKDGNRGSAAKFIKMAFENSSKLEIGIVKEFTMNFLKAATDFGELQVIKTAADEILPMKKYEFTHLLRPITKAIEIIETRDLNKYYDLQIEEREIVADVVKKITKSDELVPDEIKNKDSR